MKKFLSVFCVAAILTQPASAQMGGGQSGMSTSAPLTNGSAFDELQKLGRCVARTERKNALAMIATVPGSKDEAELFKRVLYGERSTCMFGGTKMTMSTIYARGAIAEGLLRTTGVSQDYVLPAPKAGEASNLHEVARCYTSGHQTEGLALLQTKAGSKQETAAVASIWEDFRTCMPNFNVRLNAPWIRFLLAEALLRLAPDTTLSGA
jgi:hypothetical protein